MLWGQFKRGFSVNFDGFFFKKTSVFNYDWKKKPVTKNRMSRFLSISYEGEDEIFNKISMSNRLLHPNNLG